MLEVTPYERTPNGPQPIPFTAARTPRATAYLLVRIKPGSDHDPSWRAVEVTGVGIFSEERPTIAVGGGTFATVCKADAPTYQEARDKVIETARLAWPWLHELITP